MTFRDSKLTELVERFKRLGHGAPTNDAWKVRLAELVEIAYADGVAEGERKEREANGQRLLEYSRVK